MASIQESFINLRNDLKTWITNNLRLKANKADLIAGDGTEFKFKYMIPSYYSTDGEKINITTAFELDFFK